MDDSISLTTVLGFVTGLIVFLYGIEHFGREILSLGGPVFQRWLERFTRNRIGGTLLGMAVTALIQSSTATTVITVSLVSAGLITFAQSLAVIFGANIGTTITAQLVAFKITKFAPFIIVSGFAIGIFGRQYRYFGKGIFYFGLVFFGLGLVSDAVEPVKNDPFIIDTLASLENVFLAFLAGLAFTAIVQSSSVTTGLVVVLAANGMITLEQGIPILLGTNIGTTATTLVASSKMSLHARRAAVAHTMFNVIGSLAALPLVVPFRLLVEAIGGSTAQQVANAHTIFNIVATAVFLLALNPFRRLVERIVRGDEEEIILKPQFLGDELPIDTRDAFRLIESEMAYSRVTVSRLYERVLTYQMERSPRIAAEIDKYESLSDLLDERIESALLEVSRRGLDPVQAEQATLLVRLSNSLEQLADIARDQSDLITDDRNPSPTDLMYRFRDLIPIQEHMVKTVRDFANAEKITDDIARRERRLLTTFRASLEKAYEAHLEHLQRQTTYNSAFFVEFVSLIEAMAGKLRDILDLSLRYEEVKSRVAAVPVHATQ